MKGLIKLEWILRYTIYTILVSIAWFKIYETFGTSTFWIIYIIILMIIFIMMHLDTFKILYKAFDKKKNKLIWKPKMIFKELLK